MLAAEAAEAASSEAARPVNMPNGNSAVASSGGGGAGGGVRESSRGSLGVGPTGWQVGGCVCAYLCVCM